MKKTINVLLFVSEYISMFMYFLLIVLLILPIGAMYLFEELSETIRIKRHELKG